METVLHYSWIIPVAIGVAGVFYFANKDLGRDRRVQPSQKTKD